MLDISSFKSILVIEDNQGDFVLIEDYLIDQFRTIEIQHCTNYSLAFQLLDSDKTRFDIILLDIHLPDKSGPQLINHFVSHFFEVPVIILTGYSDINLARDSLKIGYSDFLIKDELNSEVLYKSIIYSLSRNSFVKSLESEKIKFERLFNFSPQPMWIIDSNNLRFIHANYAAIDQYGYSTDEFVCMNLKNIHIESDFEKLDALLQTPNSAVYTESIYFTQRLKNGQKINVELYHSEFDSSTKNLLIITANNITERLRYIDAIKSQNEKLRSIAWTQSHMVRAPLARILGIINLLDEVPETSDELPLLLNNLKESSTEMDHIVQEIIKQTRTFEI